MAEHRHHTPRVTGSSPVRSTMRSSQWESGPLWGVSAIPVFRDERAGFDSQRRAQHCSRAEMGAVERCGLASTGFSWARFRQGYSLVGESPDVHGQLSRVRVPLPRYGSLAQWMERPVTSREAAGSSPARPTGAWYVSVLLSCAASVAYVTVRARVVGLRASRWARYYVLIVPSRPPGLAGFIVPVAELADALDLGSSAFGRVGSTPTGHTGGGGFRSFLLPLAFHSCYDGWDAVRRVSSIW